MIFAPEMLSLIGGAVGGFLMKAYTLHQADKKEQLELWMKTVQTKNDLANSAAKRVPEDKSGRLTRRILIYLITFGVILAPFFLSLMGKDVIIEVETPIKSHLFGFFESGGKTLFYKLDSYLMVKELRESLMIIIGWYFGTASAKR
jgi:hypothetical protein